MVYSCAHMATVGVKGLSISNQRSTAVLQAAHYCGHVYVYVCKLTAVNTKTADEDDYCDLVVAY